MESDSLYGFVLLEEHVEERVRVDVQIFRPVRGCLHIVVDDGLDVVCRIDVVALISQLRMEEVYLGLAYLALFNLRS